MAKQTAEALVNDSLPPAEYPAVGGQGGGSKRNVAQSVRRANPMSAKKVSGWDAARSNMKLNPARPMRGHDYQRHRFILDSYNQPHTLLLTPNNSQ